jgi:hypothetical protein
MVSSNPDLGGTLPDAWNNLLALTTVHLDDGNFTGVLIAVPSQQSQQWQLAHINASQLGPS